MNVSDKNTDKCKTIAVATMPILDYSVDFVNIISSKVNEKFEVVDINDISIPKEDAIRRDCTINSLFYNLKTNGLEDFSEMGFNDLKNGIIRTSSEAFTHLLDQPMAVIRSIRFALKYQFKLDEGIENALRNDIKNEIKVSKYINN